MITLDSPIVGAGGAVAAVIAYAYGSEGKPVAVGDYLIELERLCEIVGFDFRILAAQSAVETADWTSFWWSERLNPAGIGVTGTPSQDEVSPRFATGTDAARAHIIHMMAYYGGPYGDHKDAALEIVDHYGHLDPRLAAVSAAGFAGTVHKLGDLGNGRWATDPDYASAIAAKANAMFKEPPMPDVTFGRVPKPPILVMLCAKLGPGHGYYELGHPRDNVGVCEHITDGYGGVEFYHDFFSIGGEREADALVDFVVGRDGRIAMLNDWRGTRAPYANGNTAGVEGDGAAFLAHYPGELDPPNFHLVSIEHEGRAADDWTGAQWNASVALDAWLFDQMGVRYDSFPINQREGIVTHLFHSEFTDKGGNALDECPGRYLKQHIDQFQAEVRALMMAHQVGTIPAPPPKPPSVPWKPTETGPRKLGDTIALAFLGTATARRDVPVYDHAGKGGTRIGVVRQGATVTVRGTFRGGATRWVLIDLGDKGVGRASLSGFVERWPVP